MAPVFHSSTAKDSIIKATSSDSACEAVKDQSKKRKLSATAQMPKSLTGVAMEISNLKEVVKV